MQWQAMLEPRSAEQHRCVPEVNQQRRSVEAGRRLDVAGADSALRLVPNRRQAQLQIMTATKKGRRQLCWLVERVIFAGCWWILDGIQLFVGKKRLAPKLRKKSRNGLGLEFLDGMRRRNGYEDSVFEGSSQTETFHASLILCPAWHSIERTFKFPGVRPLQWRTRRSLTGWARTLMRRQAAFPTHHPIHLSMYICYHY